MKNHRYLDNVDQLIESGNSQIFLHGNGVNDYYLFDFYVGVRELEKSLKLYFANHKRFEYFVSIRDKRIICFDKSLKEIKIDEVFKIKKIIEGFGRDISSKDLEKKEQNIDNIKESSQNARNQNSFEYLLRNIDKKELMVFLDDFDWQSGFYSNDVDVEMVKFLKDIGVSKRSVSIVKMAEPLSLKEYGFSIDLKSDEIVFISNPTVDELKKSIMRFCLKEKIGLVESEVEDIATTIKANKKSLRNSFKILNNFKTNGIKELSLELFEKILKPNIDEKVSFDDVVLKDKDKIIKTVDTFLKDPSNAQKGILLYGPPGTGKTYIAKAIANEFKMSFFAPTLAELKGEFVGQSAKFVRELFEEARANEPSIVFLDEIDTIFRKRGGGKTDSFVEDMVNQFLVEIDGVNSAKSRVFLIGATNRLDEIDEAIKSRLSKHFSVDLPDRDSREKIIAKRFKEFDFIRADFKDEFLDRTEGFSGRDLDGLIKSIKQRGDEKILNRRDFFGSMRQYEESFIDNFIDKMGGDIEVSEPKIDFSHIVGNEEIIKALQDEIDFIKMDRAKKEQMRKFGIVQKRGTLLYGPPGNGKTTFAKALAGENNFYLVKVVSKDFASSFPEEILRKIDLIFNHTIKLSKMTQKGGVVLFFDEIDSLLGSRLDPVVRGTILKYLEDKQGIKSENSKIVLLAATNYKEKLDEASIRDGRFDNKLEVRYPTNDEATKILKQFFEQDKNLELNVNYKFYEELLSDSYEKFSIATLKNIKEQVKKEAFKAGSIENDKILINNKK